MGKSTAFERLAGVLAVLAGIDGLLYALAFVVLRNALLSALFLTLLGVLAVAVLIALYAHVRATDAPAALTALLFGLVGVVGTAIHGGYDLANAINPPSTLPAGLTDLPSQVDPRGLLAFGFTGIGLFVFGWLITQSSSLPKPLGYLACVSALLFIVIYLARLIVLDPTNPILLVPVLLNGFILSPLFYLWLGSMLWRGTQAG